jgi:branched-chain amino acid transport system substrate-binding protein
MKGKQGSQSGTLKGGSKMHTKHWKNWAVGAVVLIMVIMLAGCRQERTSQPPTLPTTKQQTIKIGAVLPLSGPSAQYGKWIQEGLELGREEINSQGGINGKQLEIIYEDDQAQPRMAASAMQKLVTTDKVPVVFGSWASSCVLAQAPIAERTRTVIMAIAISPKIRDAGDYTFRIQPDARYYLRQLVPFVCDKLKIRRVCILYVNNDFGVDQAKVFQMEFEKRGGKVLSSEGFTQGATDFRAQLSKIRVLNPEAVFMPAYTEAGYILKQARELGIKAQFIGSVPFENPDILKIAGKTAEGVIYPHHFDPDSPDPLVREYQRKYVKKYGRKSEGFAALAYDGIRIIAETLKKCGNDATCIKDALYKVKDFPGVTGPTSFDDHGDVVKPIVIKTVRNGAFVRYEGNTQ